MSVLIPFAQDKDTGKIVSIYEVPRGRKCNCVCLYCGLAVIANKGEINQDYFSHEPKKSSSKPCPISFERSVFWACRELLHSENTLNLPDYNLFLKDPMTNTSTGFHITNESSISYTEVKFESLIDSNSKHTGLLTIDKFKLAVTLSFKPSACKEHNQTPHIVIDLTETYSLFKNLKQPFKELLLDLLIHRTTNKSWLYHPRQKQAEKLFFNEIALREKKIKEDIRKANQTIIEREKAKAVITEQRQERVRVLSQHNIESKTQRRNLLAHVVTDLKDKGIYDIERCERCHFSQPINLDKCRLCGDNSISIATYSHGSLEQIASRYWQLGFAEQSLVAITDVELIANGLLDILDLTSD
ncbi:MAG: hypothetical protein ACTJIB_10460 [Pseudoalteromonas prydzensis]|uniref:hypothetical protein n=1 Tax=Pseudoalteromonas prydzensis TaxID=182141 RepID=UPI003F995294